MPESGITFHMPRNLQCFLQCAGQSLTVQRPVTPYRAGLYQTSLQQPVSCCEAQLDKQSTALTHLLLHRQACPVAVNSRRSSIVCVADKSMASGMSGAAGLCQDNLPHREQVCLSVMPVTCGAQSECKKAESRAGRSAARISATHGINMQAMHST